MTEAEQLIYSFPLASYAKEEQEKLGNFIPTLGDTIYYVLNRYFVCEATITEISFILWKEGPEKSKWFYLFKEPDMKESIFWFPVSTGEKDRLGWDVTRNAGLDELQEYKDNGYQVVNYFVDVDLPVGHSFPIEFNSKDRYGEAYKYLDHALGVLKPFKRCRKRHKAMALHHFIRSSKKFIASTNGKSVNSMDWPHYRRYGERKIYHRRR